MVRFYYDDSKWPEGQNVWTLPQQPQTVDHQEIVQKQVVVSECIRTCKGECNSPMICAYLAGLLDSNPDSRPEPSAKAKHSQTEYESALEPWGQTSADYQWCAVRMHLALNRMVKDTKVPSFWVATDAPQVSTVVCLIVIIPTHNLYAFVCTPKALLHSPTQTPIYTSSLFVRFCMGTKGTHNNSPTQFVCVCMYTEALLHSPTQTPIYTSSLFVRFCMDTKGTHNNIARPNSCFLFYILGHISLGRGRRCSRDYMALQGR